MYRISEMQPGQRGRHIARGWILEAYTVMLLAVFPFYSTDQYFSILSDRAAFFRAATLLMAAALLAEWMLFIIVSLFRKDRLPYTSYGETDISRTAGFVGNFTIGCKKIPPEYLFFFAFLFISALSTLWSEYPLKAWNGEAGRRQGLSIWLLYGVSFFCVTRFFRPKKWHLCLFLAAGAIAALWGICDYMGPGLSWWLADVKETQKNMFTSSIGNINTYTAFMAVCFSLSGTYIVHADMPDQKRLAFLLLLFSLFSTALITGRSDNAVISIAAFFLVLPLTITDTWKAGRYFCLLAAFDAAFPLVGFLSGYTKNPYLAGHEGILLGFCADSRTIILAFILGSTAATAAIFFSAGTEHPMHRFWKIWAAFLAVSVMLLALVLVHANFFADPEQYGAIGAYLRFDDSWGTHRGLCWRLAFESYTSFTSVKKLIGSGPETFGIIMKKEHYKEMIQGCGQIFDSPHNEFIQYLFCTGILGATCYYGFLAACFVKGIRGDAVRKATAVAILVYVAVSLVNISVPITQPYLILMAAWCASGRKSRELRSERKMHWKI